MSIGGSSKGVDNIGLSKDDKTSINKATIASGTITTREEQDLSTLNRDTANSKVGIKDTSVSLDVDVASLDVVGNIEKIGEDSLHAKELVQVTVEVATAKKMERLKDENGNDILDANGQVQLVETEESANGGLFDALSNMQTGVNYVNGVVTVATNEEQAQALEGMGADGVTADGVQNTLTNLSNTIAGANRQEATQIAIVDSNGINNGNLDQHIESTDESNGQTYIHIDKVDNAKDAVGVATAESFRREKIDID